MAIIFFSAPMSSATPVQAALAELEVEHEKVTLELGRGDQRKPEFLKLNPNGKVPTLVVDGTPMFEALAIMQWLGDRYGVERGLWPAADSPDRLRALAWSTWSYVSYGALVQCLNRTSSPRVPVEQHNAKTAAQVRDELRAMLSVLDTQLQGAPYLLGHDYGLTDLIVSGSVRYGSLCGASTERHPHVSAWVEHCFSRPAIRGAWG